MDFSEEEITRIVACAMKQRVITERPVTEQESGVETEDDSEGDDE